MRTAVSSLALLSTFASLSTPAHASSPAGHQQAIARSAIHRRAESSAATSTAAAHARTSTTTQAAAAATVTPQAKVNAAAAAASTPLPLTEYTYSALSDVPYQVNPYKSTRGPQSGYNQCNSTTQGETSQCQTLIINSIDDFCLWGLPGGPSDLSTIGDAEAAVVAYCVKDTHGSRSIPGGAITGLQVMRTKAYIQITGFLDQTALGMTKDDSGGELDPHGADLMGNPLGGLVFSSGLPSGDNSTETQVVEWNNFIGGGSFCFKLCDPNYKGDSNNYCENRYDLMGCSYNMPSAAKDGEFTDCDGDLQDVVGIYTENGKIMTYSQPPEGSPVNPPYTPRVPASSNCKTYQSTAILAAVTTSTSASSASATTTGSVSASATAARQSASSAASAAAASASASAHSGSTIAAFLPSAFGALVVAGGIAVLF